MADKGFFVIPYTYFRENNYITVLISVLREACYLALHFELTYRMENFRIELIALWPLYCRLFLFICD